MRLHRIALGVGLGLLAATAGAQAPAPTPAPADRCAADLQQWQLYAGALKTARDNLEQDLAVTRAELTRLRAAVSAPKP